MVLTGYHISKEIEESLRELTNYNPEEHGELLDHITDKLKKRGLDVIVMRVKDSVGDYPFVNKIKVEGIDQQIIVKRKRITKIKPGFIKDIVKDEYIIEFDNFLAEGFVPGEFIKKWESVESGESTTHHLAP